MDIKLHHFEDTITAPATSVGSGAISVIRLSGPMALKIVDKCVDFASGTAVNSKGYSLKFGELLSDGGDTIDEVLVSVFHSPHSYTGEDSAEISCHASTYIVSAIVERLCECGARVAQPGEFTLRAFINGKMDLAQAEAVADVISSDSESSHCIAMRQMKGVLSKELAGLREQLVELTSLLELELDFSEEDVEFADRDKLKVLTERVLNHVTGLADSFKLGNALKRGIPVAIVGSVNTGKSTLLNALLSDDRAIVSSFAGTTRDTIEELLNIDGLLFRLVDTAGIRDTEEIIEKIGIERSLKALHEADDILLVLDITRPLVQILSDLERLIKEIDFKSQSLFILLNKVDIFANKHSNNVNFETDSGMNKIVSVKNSIVSFLEHHDLNSNSHQNDVHVLEISAKTGYGLNKLRKTLYSDHKEQILRSTNGTNSLVTNQRHYEALLRSADALKRVKSGLDDSSCTIQSSADLLAEDLREALYQLGSILGEVTSDEILGSIFSKFCIGK